MIRISGICDWSIFRESFRTGGLAPCASAMRDITTAEVMAAARLPALWPAVLAVHYGRRAVRLGEPEYRLRRLINQRLGHRNFNAYINGYRLADATAALTTSAADCASSIV